MLNYAEASALATSLSKYMLLVFFGPLGFLMGWRLIVSYFKWGIPAERDIDMHDTVYNAVLDAVADSQTQPTEIELVS